jgi:predicted transcriptional regulator YdeE
VSSLTRHGEWSRAAAKGAWMNVYHTFMPQKGYRIAMYKLVVFKVYHVTSTQRKFI